MPNSINGHVHIDVKVPIYVSVHPDGIVTYLTAAGHRESGLGLVADHSEFGPGPCCTPEELVSWFRSMADAVEAAWEAYWLHRVAEVPA